MGGSIRRAVVAAVMVGVVAAGPAVLSATSAGAWFRGGTEGCSPGYWKNHSDAWADTAFSTSDTIGGVFSLPAELSSFSDETLLAALDGGGGPGVDGAAVILFRAAAAGLLNATHATLQYPAGKSTIIKHVNAALATLDRDTILALAGKLDKKNNLSCTLS